MPKPERAPEPLPLLGPREAVEYLRGKGYRIGFAWQDVWQEEHARAFTVAKAMSVDLLETIRAAVDKALANGETLEQFRAELTPVLQAKGWWGRQQMLDPATGQMKTVQLGSPRRLKIIYQMNLRMAQAAGRWEQIQRTKKALPYLRYTAVMDARTRPEHAEWHGTILRVDDPWWDTHYPPCGWNCRCTTIQLDADTIADRGWKVDDAPPPAGPPVAYTNPRTGEVSELPDGIDPGFAYNVGKAWLGGIEPPILPEPLLPDLEPGVSPRPHDPSGAPEGGAPAPRAPIDVTAPATPPAEGAPSAAEPVSSPRPRVPTGAPELDTLLPETVSATDAIDAFVDGARGEAPGGIDGAGSIVLDRSGWPLPIGRRWFRGADGELAVPTGDRRRVLGLVGRAIAAPRQIRLRWVIGANGAPMLFRRYIADVDGLAIVVDVGRAGWRYATARDAGFDLSALASGEIAWTSR